MIMIINDRNYSVALAKRKKYVIKTEKLNLIKFSKE